MKSFLPSILLLAGLLLLSLLNCSAIIRNTDRWSCEVDAAARLAEKGDWDEAKATLQNGYRDWSSRQTYLHIVVRHEDVDDAEAMYRRAAAFAATQELSEFQAELADLRDQLRLLAEMERVSIKNIL
jgi:hypothetical protein